MSWTIRATALDSPTGAPANLSRSVTDTAPATDTTGGLPRAISDSAQAAETALSGLGLARAISDTAPATDTASATRTQPGDIIAVAVGADGWYADITMAGLGSGGTYAFGLGTNGDPATGTPNITFTVVSLGYDTTGTATTTTRTIYGTKQVRNPYPNATTNREVASGGNVVVRVALSDYIFSKDNTGTGNSGTSPTATFLSGFYTQGTPSRAATNVAVTNGSTRAYPRVIGNWSWPGYDKLASSFPLRAVAFHASANSGRPVQCVKFTSTDQHSNSTTVTVNAPTVDSTIGDDTTVVEYVATMNGSGFTQGDTVTSNFIAYPAVGDTTSLLDTSLGSAQPTPLYGPITAVCDRTGAYATSVAVVDPVAGNDSTGVITGSFTVGNPPAAYLTLAAAYNGLRTYNNTNYSRNNCGGSTVYIQTGSVAWTGGTPTLGTTPDTWLTIAKFPTATRSSVIIASYSTTQSLGLKVKIQDVTITLNSASGGISPGTGSYLWTDRCEFNCPTANQPPIVTVTEWYITRSLITSLNMGLQLYDRGAVALIRGNTVISTAVYNHIYTALGNTFPAAPTIVDSYAGQTIPTSVNTVFAFNRVSGTIGGNTPVLLRKSLTDTHGCAVIQNLMEIGPSSVANVIGIAADNTVNTPVNNVLVWHNVIVGQRANIAYNEQDSFTGGGGFLYRLGWSVKANIFDDVNIKSDTAVVGAGQLADGNKVGNWSFLYGCGCSGNFYPETTGIGAAGAFLFEFPGLKSYQPAASGQPPSGSTDAATYPGFVNRKSFDGSTSGTGGGNYHLMISSPAASLQRDFVMPFDLAGLARQAVDAAGVYALPPGRSITDAAPAVDSVARSALVDTRAMVDSAPAVEALVRSGSWSRSVSDSGPAVEAVTRASLVRSRSVTDTASATDVAIPGIIIPTSRPVTDLAPAVEAVTRGVVLPRGVADVAHATEVLSRILVGARPLADIAPATDTVARVTPSRVRSIADTAPATDTANSGNRRTVTDSAPAVESTTRTLLIVTRPSTETAAAIDAILRRIVDARFVADIAAATDVVSGVLVGPGRTVTDRAPGIDVATRLAVTLIRTVTDTAPATDITKIAIVTIPQVTRGKITFIDVD